MINQPSLGVCRLCGSSLRETFVDLGMSPLCESYVSADHLNGVEAFYPLHVLLCSNCLLVQLGEYVSPDVIFSEYAYFSSYSDSWLNHAREYCRMITKRLGLNAQSLVVELASNDGYLLSNFVADGIPVLGIDPAANVAKAAVSKGVPTMVRFFGEAVAREIVEQGKRADLIVANNVLAHVPALNDFLAGVKTLLKPGGVFTAEFPHLQRLVEGNQFDTIYHEHFSYFSFLTAERALDRHDLVVFDVEELSTHGGSLRIFAAPRQDGSRPVSDRVQLLRAREQALGYHTFEGHGGFNEKVIETKYRLLECLIGLRRGGRRVVGYGAPGKGNTLLNYCGIRTDLLEFTVDRNPYKQGKFLPGTRIPIHSPEKIAECRPDYVFILPWNLRQEISEQLKSIRNWGGRFIVPIPEVATF